MAGETIAYVRVSTVEQNEERQVEMLKKIWAHGLCAHILLDNQGVGGRTSRAFLRLGGISLSSAKPS